MASLDDRRPFQFSLRTLLWFTTAVAVVCASFACAKRAWGDPGGLAWLAFVFLLWPTLAAIAVWSFPEVSFKVRTRMYWAIGAVVVLTVWSRAWPPYPALLGAFVATILAALIVWAPQGLMVFAAMTFARERSRKGESKESDDVPAIDVVPPLPHVDIPSDCG
jgi:hypothetical protein